MLWCEPFGHTGVENLLDRSLPRMMDSYIFFHDQEPVNSIVYDELFSLAKLRGRDLTGGKIYGGPPVDLDRVPGIMVTSELGQAVDEVCQHYGWTPSYYFYHGWAALDWYRGYNRSFQLMPPEARSPTKTFMCPNRIIGGERRHRALLLYWFEKLGLMHNHVSAPMVCPETGEDIVLIANKYRDMLPDITDVVCRMSVPKFFQGEDTNVMSSCWLGNWPEVHDSLLYVVTETVFSGRRLHLTEKTFKPMALGMPFVILSTAGSLDYLRSYGFRSFDSIWSEAYDCENNDLERIRQVAQLLRDLDALSPAEKKHLWQHCLPIIKHNWTWFYHGGFEQRLWQELTSMVESWR